MGTSRRLARDLAFVLVLGMTTTATADGFYVAESLGGGPYKGELAAYGSGGPRLQVGFGYRRGERTYEFVFGGVASDLFYIDCYGDECMDQSNVGDYFYVGGDLRRAWPVARTRWRGLNASFVLHAGPRLVFGDRALRGYNGVGANAGAAIEGNAWVIGYFLDVSMDAVWMQMPADTVSGLAPSIMFGGKVGWL